MEPHQPISNLVVKHCSGEDTLEAALRENSSMPGSTQTNTILFSHYKLSAANGHLQGLIKSELVAQWTRARGYEPLGRGFDSLQARSQF